MCFVKFEYVFEEFQMTASYTKKPLLQAFYDLYKNESGLLDCKKVSNALLDNKTKDYFSITKDIILDRAKEQISQLKNEIDKKVKENINGFSYNRRKKLELDAQVEEKKKIKQMRDKEEQKYLTEVNNTIPSGKFVHRVFKKRKEHYLNLN